MKIGNAVISIYWRTREREGKKMYMERGREGKKMEGVGGRIVNGRGKSI